MKLSLVIPCYNEQDNVQPMYEAVEAAFVALPEAIRSYELVFVNDGSKDETAARLRALHKAHPARVSVVDFSRNFGKEAAVYAGLTHASGDFISIIDADLQQRPEIVVEMVQHLLDDENCDVVAAYQDKRIEGRCISFIKKMFYKVINKACDIEFISGASDFRTFRRTVADAILSVQEYYRFSKGIFSWIGFNTYFMPYTAEKRHAGQTKWSFFKLLRYAFGGIMSFSTFPLKLSTWMGVLFSFASLVYMVVTVVQKLAFGVDVPGYATIVVLILLLGGIQLLILGLMGEYLARVYMEGKHRPIYIERQYLEAEDSADA